MRWWFSLEWLIRYRERLRMTQGSRPVKNDVQPRLEPLETRFMFANNVWLPLQLGVFDGTNQNNAAMPLFQPATIAVLPQLGAQITSMTGGGEFSLTADGDYQLTCDPGRAIRRSRRQLHVH